MALMTGRVFFNKVSERSRNNMNFENIKLSVVVPVYNEKATLLEILTRIRAVEIPKEIILVDDCSRDGTRQLLLGLAHDPENKDLKIFFHEKNQGKGAALRTGFEKATGDFVIVQDADLEYDPQDYLALLAPILEKRADVVYGSRFVGQYQNMISLHRMGNRFLTLLTNFLYHTSISDMETCYKLMPAAFVKAIRIESNRFDFEPEITAKILKRKLRVLEVPIRYLGRSFSEGKKITWRDGFSAVWTLLKFRFKG
jgi:glycosyltransferase involved in cell wall biosynthesis